MNALSSAFSQIKRFLNFISKPFKPIWAWRAKNAENHPKISRFLLFFYPFFFIFLIEFNQLQSFPALWEFITQSTSVFIFDILLCIVVYFSIVFTLRSTLFAVAATGIPLYALSCAEFFKFKSTGTHFMLTDILLAPETKELTKMGQVELNFWIVFDALLLIAYIVLCFVFKPSLKMKWRKSVLIGLAGAAACTAVLVTPLSDRIFTIMNVRYEATLNSYENNEKFKRNNMIAFLAQNATEYFRSAFEMPEEYSEEAVNAVLVPGTEDVAASENMVKPNVIMVMSESFGDFRQFPELPIGDTYYENLDRMGNEGYSGTLVVPAFGNATVKTEFELMMGLPVKSFDDNSRPQRLLLNRQQESFAQYFSGIGYHSVFLHPYSSTFYGRKKIYGRYGFDEQIYKVDLSVTDIEFHRFSSDFTAYRQVLKTIDDNEDPVYLHLTTIQNHKPYMFDENQLEFDYYMEGIKQSDEALGLLMDELKALEEPTVVLFVGDHFPFFTEEGDPYDYLGINVDNAYTLYKQHFAAWSNYGYVFSPPEDVEFSAFYLLHLLIDDLGLPKTTLTNTILSQFDEYPVYSTNYDEIIPPNLTLDLISYDVAMGEMYLPTDAIDKNSVRIAEKEEETRDQLIPEPAAN